MSEKPYQWTTLSTGELDANAFWSHWRDTFRTPSGREGVYDYTVHGNAVAIVARLNDGRFVMIREYRYLFNQLSLAVAQGGIETGETPEVAAHREFFEETGYRAGSMISLGVCGSAPAFSKEVIHVFFAEELLLEGQKQEEEIEAVLLMTKEEVENAIRSGEMWDSHAIAAWHMAQVYLDAR